MSSSRSPRMASDATTQDEEAPMIRKRDVAVRLARPPFASYFLTLFLVLLLLASSIIGFALQLVLAVVTSPLLICSNGLLRFQYIQSAVFRTTQAFFVVTCNPFWCPNLWYVGDEPGVPGKGPEGQGNVIFVNHRSNADPWFTAWVQMVACLEAKYVYKSMLRKIPILGWSCMLAGDLPVFAGDPNAREQLLEGARTLLEEGYNIVVFPEGTRSPSGVLQDFKPAFFQLCCDLGAAAVPICVLGTERAWPQGGMRVGCACMTAIIGDALTPLEKESGSDLAGRMRALMERMPAEVREEANLPDDDPFFTRKWYSWFELPADLRTLRLDEQLARLRKATGREKGKNLA